MVPLHPVPRSPGVPRPLAGALRGLGHHAPDVHPGRRGPSDATHPGRRGDVPRAQVPAQDHRTGPLSRRDARAVALRQTGAPRGAAAAHPELVRQVPVGETDHPVRHTMTASLHTLLDVALRTSIVYLALLVGLRLTGTRQLGQMSTFDLVLLLIIANAVQNAMVGPDTSLAGGLVAAGVLIGWHRVIDWWRVRSRGVSKLLAGEGIMLIHDGKILQEHCERAGITHDELRQALREHGVANIQDVMLAVLEPDGSISVIRNDDMKAGDRPHRRIRAIRRNP